MRQPLHTGRAGDYNTLHHRRESAFLEFFPDFRMHVLVNKVQPKTTYIVNQVELQVAGCARQRHFITGLIEKTTSGIDMTSVKPAPHASYLSAKLAAAGAGIAG
jgi:hypothetical protein